MCRGLGGIPGLNPWNALVAIVFIYWLMFRSRQGLKWDVPRWVIGLAVLYSVIALVSFSRALWNHDLFPIQSRFGGLRFSPLRFIADSLVTSLKCLLPAIMLFDGARTRRRLTIGLIVTLGLSLYYGTVVMRYVPISGLRELDAETRRERSEVTDSTGLHANAAAMVFATSSWALLAARKLKRRWYHAVFWWGGATITALALALCRSRAGYLAFVAVGVLYAALLWRWLFFALPAGLLLICTLFPGVQQRVMIGVGIRDASGEQTQDWEAVSAGRTTMIWPPVIEQIKESPLIGSGRLAILQPPVYDKILAVYDDDVPDHPHSAYLESVLDTGVVGAIGLIAPYLAMFWISVALFRDRKDPLHEAIGGAGLAATVSLFVMGISGQSFFPKENCLTAFCVYGLVLRAWLERQKLRAGVRTHGRSNVSGKRASVVPLARTCHG